MNEVEDRRKTNRRRALLMAGGFVAASARLDRLGLVTGAGTGATHGNVPAGSRPWTGPPWRRRPRLQTLFRNDMFALYRPLKAQRDGAGSFEAEQASKTSAWLRG